MKKLVFVLGLLFTSAVVGADSFVVKKEKKVSSSTLKERCFDDLMAAVKQTPAILQEIAQFQEQAMDIVTAIAENEFFDTATKEQLQQDAKAYEKCRLELEKAEIIIREQKDFLRKQKEKYKK